MGGIGLLVRAEARRRWVALALIGLLVGVIGAAVVTSVAGARRSSTAYDRLAERTGQPDATLVSFLEGDFVDRVVDLPEVADAWRLRGVVGQVLDVPEVTYLSVVSGGPRPAGLFTPLVEDGRLPDDDVATEVAIDQGLAREADVGVGDHVRLALLTQDEFAAFDTGFGEPDGPTVDLEVVGTFRVAGNETSESVGILGTPAFAQLAAEAGGGDGAMIHLVDEPGAVDDFSREVLDLAAQYDVPANAEELGVYDLRLAEEDRDRSHASGRVVANGLLLVGAVGLLVGLLGLAQTVLRHQSRSITTSSALPALGLDRRERVLAAVLPFAVVTAPVAAVVTVVGAIALSPLLPIGAARRIEPSPGVEVNIAVLAFGAVAAVLLLLVLVAAVAAFAVRRRRPPRPGGMSMLGRTARSGLPFTVSIGTGLALDRGRGGAAVPVRAALAGVVLATAAVVGATAFAHSLDRLVDTPARYGSPGDLLVADARQDVVDELEADPDVAALLDARGFDLTIEGARRDALSTEVLKGSIGFTYLDGRPPTGPSEVALGPALASRLGVGLDDRVMLDDLGEEATVVGMVLARGDTGNSYAGSAVVDHDLREQIEGGGAFREVLVDYAEGVDVDAKAEALGADHEIERFEPPIRIVDLDQVRTLPLILAGAAGLLGVVLLGHALAVTVRRRGRDLALLRALGARPGQTATAVVVMTLIIVVLGVAAGIPLGLLAGNLAWRAIAESMDVAGDLLAPVVVSLLCLPVAVVVGLLAAIVPTWRASRLEVAEQLRRE
jgi:ABC-type lipoprotein release transport system permease subunit